MIKGFSLLFAASALLAEPAHADTVCEWMDFAQAIQTATQRPAPTSARTPDLERVQTRTALAMFEALNAIDRKYETYLGMPSADASASAEAAAATAAYEILKASYPEQKTALEESYAIALETVTDRGARDKGISIGKAAAALAMTAGGIDPAIRQTPYLPRTQPGVWVPTQLPVLEPYNSAFKPWIMERPDSVRPGPPPDLASKRWASDYEEVKRVGAKESKARTPMRP